MFSVQCSVFSVHWPVCIVEYAMLSVVLSLIVECSVLRHYLGAVSDEWLPGSFTLKWKFINHSDN